MMTLEDAKVQAEIWAQYRPYNDQSELAPEQKSALAYFMTDNHQAKWEDLPDWQRASIAASFTEVFNQFPETDYVPACEFCSCDSDMVEEIYLGENSNLLLCGSCSTAYNQGWFDALKKLNKEDNLDDHPRVYTLPR